jgi:hypothetical protein
VSFNDTLTATIPGTPGTSYMAQTPLKESQVAQANSVNKIMNGDWIWHPNRPLEGDPGASKSQRSTWHNYKGQRFVNLLFGDAHVKTTRLMDSATDFSTQVTAQGWW